MFLTLNEWLLDKVNNFPGCGGLFAIDILQPLRAGYEVQGGYETDSEPIILLWRLLCFIFSCRIITETSGLLATASTAEPYYF